MRKPPCCHGPPGLVISPAAGKGLARAMTGIVIVILIAVLGEKILRHRARGAQTGAYGGRKHIYQKAHRAVHIIGVIVGSVAFHDSTAEHALIHTRGMAVLVGDGLDSHQRARGVETRIGKAAIKLDHLVCPTHAIALSG